MLFSSGDDRFLTQKALQTVAAGRQAENLLDFDDEPATDGQPTGLAATEIFSRPAAASLISGTSTNPLDDLVSIFGGGPAAAAATPNPLGGFGFGGGGFGPAPSPLPPQTPVTASLGPFGSQAQKPAEDLLGLF
jgi:AP-1 complex subunit beta-1